MMRKAHRGRWGLRGEHRASEGEGGEGRRCGMGLGGTHCALSLVCDGVQHDITGTPGRIGVSLSDTLHQQQGTTQSPTLPVARWNLFLSPVTAY